VEDRARPRGGPLDRSPVADVAFDDLEVGSVRAGGRQVGQLSGAEVVEHPYTSTVREQTRGQVRADEPGTTGHEKELRHGNCGQGLSNNGGWIKVIHMAGRSEG
jgi:hypothetical protein